MDVESGSKIQTTSSMFGVPVTSIKNHLYGITQSCKWGKFRVLQKGEHESLVASNQTSSNIHKVKLKNGRHYVKEGATFEEWDF
jgi:hypothetical protein